MAAAAINEKINYIEASDDPLSADIGIVQAESGVWLYDVGSGEKNIEGLNGSYSIVLSHFHQDHTGNLGSPSTQGCARIGISRWRF